MTVSVGTSEGLRERLSALSVAVLLAVRAAPAASTVLVLATLVGGANPVVAAWLTKLMLDRIVAGPSVGLRWMVMLALALAGTGILAALIPHATAYAAAELNRRVRLVVADRLFLKVGSLPGLARMESPPFYDRLMLAQQSGGESPGQVVLGVCVVIQGSITLGGFIVTLCMLSPVMAVTVVLAAAPALAGEVILNRRRAKLLWRLGPAERRELFYAGLLRDLEAAKEVRIFGLADFLRGRMIRELNTINVGKRALDRRVLHTQGGLSLLSASVVGGGLIWVAREAMSGRIGVGDLSIFVTSVAGTQAALSNLVRGLSTIHQSLLLFEHYQTVLRTPTDLPLAAVPRATPPLRTGIEVRDVWFRYDQDQPWILRGVNLVIPHGQAVGLVGYNGAGKSTLVKLLCRLYDPSRGCITWDGIDIREFDPAELRDRMTAVFQDYTCYDLTAEENIGLGDLSALGDRDRIVAAAGLAGTHEVISQLPRGYDTLLSRMFADNDPDDPRAGVLLSGGQWQRVALARALVRKERDLLILDEPSAGLDAQAEHEVHSRLKEYREGQTSLLISHRLGTIRDASLIAVLSDGQIVERGTHQQLLAADGLYRRLFAIQSEGYRDHSDEDVGTCTEKVLDLYSGPQP